MKGGWHFDQFLSSAVAKGSEVAHAAAKAIVGPECLLNYTIDEQPVASVGTIWTIYSARSKKEAAPYPTVSVWVLDKRSLVSSGGDRNSSRRLETLIELSKASVQHLVRLKHPSILKLIHPLEETRTQIVFVTEPVFASLDSVLHTNTNGQLPEQIQSELRQLKLSELEMKHGLLQIADALSFLHNDAALVHRAVSPRSIILTKSGAWKLAGFDFAISLEIHTKGNNTFDYSDRHPSTLGSALQPALAYTAPELVATGSSVALLPSVDVFSLALVAYQLTAHRALLPQACSLIEYESVIRGLSLMDLSGAPEQLKPMLRQMLAPAPEARPPIAAFGGSPYFLGDVHLRALKFLDSMLAKSVDQRAAFLNDLPRMAVHWDNRVLLYKVLHPMLQELRSKELQMAVLPIIMTIIKIQSSEEFLAVTLPALTPLLDNATGPALLQLTQATPLLQSATGGKSRAALLVAKLLVRALDCGESLCQEEALKQILSLSQNLDYEGLKTGVLPAIYAACLATTSASVRVSSFKALAAVGSRMDQTEAEKMLAMAAQVVSVDKTAPTAMCVLGLGDSLAKRWGAKLAAERVLPCIAPLLVAPSLSIQQFSTVTKTVKDILALIEKARRGESGSEKEERIGSSTNGGSSGTSTDDSLLQWPYAATPEVAKHGEGIKSSAGLMHLNMSGIQKVDQIGAKSSQGFVSSTALSPMKQRASSMVAAKTSDSGDGDWLAKSLGYNTKPKAHNSSCIQAPADFPSAPVDPFAWPMPASAAPSVATAPVANVTNRSATAWIGATAASGTFQKPSSPPLASVIDPFDDLALQHSANSSPQKLPAPRQNTNISTIPPSLI